MDRSGRYQYAAWRIACRKPADLPVEQPTKFELYLKDKHVTSSQALLTIFVLATVGHTQPLQAEPLWFPGGSYEVTARLELPHLERWGVDKTTTVCLPDSRGAGEIPVPVVSANSPFAKCSAANLMADGSRLEYDIVCRERGAARGHAVYELSTNAFTGRVAMVMGAKNMTMTEVQHARKIGECSSARKTLVD